jgi:hypothetical protein
MLEAFEVLRKQNMPGNNEGEWLWPCVQMRPDWRRMRSQRWQCTGRRCLGQTCCGVRQFAVVHSGLLVSSNTEADQPPIRARA